MFEVLFLGTNGSCAFNSGNRPRYGTNTLCTVIRAGDSTLIFDAGTGICGVNDLDVYKSKKLNLFISHFHKDHISGLLFWEALFDAGKEIDIYGMGDIRKHINHWLKEPYQPVGIDAFQAKLTFNSIDDGTLVLLDGGVAVSCIPMNHPGGCLGYRIDYGDKSVCYMTDVELGDPEADEKLVAFARNTDLLITDSQFEDGKKNKGWGHSTPKECAALAQSANAKKLALYHYSYHCADGDIDRLTESAKGVFKDTFASADWMRVEI
jgi:ribonuclease BN (tRNA processing enzyme)